MSLDTLRRESLWAQLKIFSVLETILRLMETQLISAPIKDNPVCAVCAEINLSNGRRLSKKQDSNPVFA